MKELTIEQKAQRYDEALGRAKEIHAEERAQPFDVMLKVFPELKESEDERIRKEMISWLKGFIGEEEGCGYTEDEIKERIAWFEKQGENISLPKFTFDDVLALQCVMETTKKVQEDKELYEQLQSLHDRLHDAYWLEKQGEQKPAWSEEDEAKLKSILFHIEDVENKDVIDWLKSLKERYTWRPSEEQMKALNYVVNLMASSESPKENDYYYNVFKDLKEQLKKLNG